MSENEHKYPEKSPRERSPHREKSSPSSPSKGSPAKERDSDHKDKNKLYPDMENEYRNSNEKKMKGSREILKDKADKKKDKGKKEIDSDPSAIVQAEEIHRALAKEKKGFKDFERLRLLGKGGLGHVYLVRPIGTHQLYAMKVLRKKDMVEQKKVKRVLTEREVLATADHPFIATLYYSFQSQTQLCFIIQYCAGGEFYRWIKAEPMQCFTEDQTKFYSAEVLLALEYLHAKGFIYRDLKPENILMHATGHIMLTDFDLSKHATTPVRPRIVTKPYSGDSGVVQEPELVTNSFVGTEEYLAPEIIKGKGHSATVDWWTFGILLFEMLFGTTPFRGRSRNDTFANIEKNKFVIPEHRRHSLSKHCKKLLIALLETDPKKRLGGLGGATDIKDHPFYKDWKWQIMKDQTPPIIPQLTSPTDLQYFDKIEDDWVLDQEDIDPTNLGESDPFRPFQNLDFPERDIADNDR